MADSAFTWDDRNGQYHDPQGRPVLTPRVEAALERIVTETRARLLVLGQQRADGGNTADWRAEVQAELRVAHLTAAAVAHGGLSQMDPSMRGFVGSRLRAQFDFLSGLALDTAPGEFGPAAMARLAQYADGAVRGTYYEVTRRDAGARGETEERNVQGGTRGGSCEECPRLSDAGWVPLGTLPPIGARSCRGNCACSIQTRAPEPAEAA